MSDLARLSDTIRRTGFAFVHTDAMQAALDQAGSLADWTAFAESWNGLGLDTYMADGGRYRKRRFAVFGTTGAEIRRKPRQPHYQSRDYNPLNGGIERWFSPIEPEIAAGPTMTTILCYCRDLFETLSGRQDWHIEVHQFRIEARRGVEGRPTPEGMHRDGVDHVLVLLVGRRNIQSGMTTIHALNGHMLGSFTLTQPLDAALVDDARVMHGVTPVEPVDPVQPGFRDVLVVTFRRAADG